MTRLALAPELGPARVYAGAALAELESAYCISLRTIDAELAESLRHRVDEVLGAGDGTAEPASAVSSAVTDRERACFDLADQFVVHVSGVTAAQRAAVAAALGAEQLHELARMLYVFDLTARLKLSLGRLFEPVDAGSDDTTPREEKPLEVSLEGLHAAAMRLQSLDPVTTELVRLHCARYHDCKT